MKMVIGLYSARIFPRNHSYTSWKYVHINPEMGDHGNVNSLKGLPFGWRDIGNEHFSESTFPDGAE